MTSDEIKKMYSMRDILMRYGIQPNRAGFIRCPFHKEKTASMKIYKDSYYCFGCGASGDIFDFVCRMDNLTFRAAFLSMGGTYEKETFRDKTARYHAQKQREQRQRQANDLEAKRKLNNDLIDIYRDWYQRSEPFSDTWTDCYNALQHQLYLHGILNGLG
ncbi:CHC2 zinc finger domain-containing protein [Massilistercora timonensis]|uniref:CHC2 zinc finger domain-containing protein n=1 Tax=Massilistercora timonensis TaxID=2086584 RepID=UPI003AB3413C